MHIGHSNRECGQCDTYHQEQGDQRKHGSPARPVGVTVMRSGTAHEVRLRSDCVIGWCVPGIPPYKRWETTLAVRVGLPTNPKSIEFELSGALQVTVISAPSAVEEF